MDDGGGFVTGRVSGLGETPGEINVLRVHPLFLVEATDLVEVVPSDQQKGAERPVDPSRAIRVPVALDAELIAKPGTEAVKPKPEDRGQRGGGESMYGLLGRAVGQDQPGGDRARRRVRLAGAKQGLERPGVSSMSALAGATQSERLRRAARFTARPKPMFSPGCISSTHGKLSRTSSGEPSVEPLSTTVTAASPESLSGRMLSRQRERRSRVFHETTAIVIGGSLTLGRG